MEKSDRPLDEQETVGKLLAGLERAASDLSTLVQYGRPIELKRQSGIDLQKIMRGVVATLSDPARATGPLNGQITIESTSEPILGEFDQALLAEALRSISIGALKIRQLRDKEAKLDVRLSLSEADSTAEIDWLGLEALDHDPFSAFAGSDEIRMSLAAKIISAHGGSATQEQNRLRVRLPVRT